MNSPIYIGMAIVILVVIAPIMLYLEYRKARKNPTEKVGLWQISRWSAFKLQAAAMAVLYILIIAVAVFVAGRVSGIFSTLSQS